jgi:diguanylate cyclase (GGDEF)-like protein
VIESSAGDADHRRLERVLSITRDILRAPDLDFALESIARGVADVFGFRYVTIVISEDDGDVLYRRVMYGYPPEIVARRRNERIERSAILALLGGRFEIDENCYFLPAESEADWARSIYTGALPRDAPRASATSWHERDSLCLVLRDEQGVMIGYMSPDAPIDGNIPDPDELHAMDLFVNLMGLALAKARAQARLRHEATHDGLTGLANRALFGERLADELERRREMPSRASAVLFFDLNDFKQINDTLGHAAGDAMLRVVAERLLRAVRANDLVARIGGDEFAVLLSDRNDSSAVDATVARIQEALVAPVAIEGRTVYVTASVGIALTDRGDEGVEDILRRADAAMYHAKSLGHARFAYFAEFMLNEATRRLALSGDLRAAVEAREFGLDYQPIIRLADGAIVGFEALVRWRGARGEVFPAEFVPLAEEFGLMVPIGRFVMVEALRALGRWQHKTGNLDLRMHVNLSVPELLEPSLVAFIVRHLALAGVAPRSLTIELTESAIMRGNAFALGRLSSLRERGVSLCIDDFGTGYSSLRYLREFAVDAMKIDRSFVESTDGTLGAAPIVRVLTQLGEAYQCEVVAEGVETAAQAAALEGLGCRYAQGFYFYRPMSGRAIDALLEDRALNAETPSYPAILSDASAKLGL